MTPTSGAGSGSATAPTGGAPSPKQANNSGLNSLANEQAFLQLLVAQLQNQDPTAPQDGTQFVSQLAQFSSLEQQIQMRADLDNMNSLFTSSASNTQPPAGSTQS